MAAMLVADASTKSTTSAPRDNASRPRAPEPENRSSTRAPASHGFTMLIHASRTRSPVGRTRSSDGGSMRRPRHLPATILTWPSAAEVGEARLDPRYALILVAFESESHVDGGADVELPCA